MDTYETLEKRFYKDGDSQRTANNKAEALTRLESSSAFRTGVYLNTGELFLSVPRELSNLNEKMLRVERKVSVLWNKLPGIAQGAYLRGLILDEIVSTNEMEGVHSTRRQIEKALNSVATDEPSAQIKRFREFAQLYLELTDRNHVYPQTPKDIRDIYDAVVAGVLKKKDRPDGLLFRAGAVDVVAASQRVAHTGVTPEAKIAEMLQQMIDLVANENMPATYSAIVSHALFEYIHPFYDGNGRTGRYLLSLYLSEPLSQPTILSLSKTIAENKTLYYKAFESVENVLNHAEATYFVLQMMELIRKAQDALIATMEQRQQQLDDAFDFVQTLAGAPYYLTENACEILYFMIQYYLFAAFPEATLDDLSGHINMAHQTTRKYARELEEKGLLETRSLRPLRFVLTDTAVSALGLSA